MFNSFKSHQLKTTKRFRFWKVFWVVLGFYVLMVLLGIIAMSMSPAREKNWDPRELFTIKNIISHCVNFVFVVFYYYFTLNAWYGLMRDRKGVIPYIRIGVFIVLALAAFYLLNHYFINTDKRMQDLSVKLLVFSYTVSTIFYIGFSLLIAYFVYLWDAKQQRKVLEEQKLQLEIEKSTANFNFLKAQINPHFLHNTLNFLYAKSLPYSEELSEGILTLSDIMRYALSEGNAKDGKAPLKDEIEHMRNVIKINQLRFSNQLNVEFEVEGVVNGATIIPFVLITLVENAFKHGDLKTTTDPIVIRVKVDGNRLYFYCRNRKKSGPKELSTGIGLENIRKRLDLAYGQDYEFRVKDEAEYYTTELTISKL